MVSGILNINKPQGITSHDVVNRVRRVTGIRKVGHAGALDPLATGVLLICIGRATRLSEYLTASEKSYHATVRLGIETDTYDADGEALADKPVSVGQDQVGAALQSFSGAIAQVPPMYSAIKQGGQPLYKLARRGVSVERKPRPVQISHIAMSAWSPPDFEFDVTCSPGTYVRSLAHDLGQKLSCGAHLRSLVRTRSGQFDLAKATSLDELTPENWQSFLQPMTLAVVNLALITLDDQEAERLLFGQAIPRRPEHPPAALAQVQTIAGDLLAIVKASPDQTEWLPHKVFGSPSPKPSPDGTSQRPQPGPA